MVLPARGAVVFVHGCFWHHHGCDNSVLPKTRRAFWREKLLGNKRRDARRATELRALGWRVMVVWECEVNRGAVLARLARKLRG
jgi:DNA mismatch endonuclease (patch repair protein)